MPKIEIKRGSDSKFPWEVWEADYRVDAFSTLDEAHGYQIDLVKWWKARK